MNDQQHDALVGAFEFFYHRDGMAAAVRCASVKWSPLTRELGESLHQLAADGEDLGPTTSMMVAHVVGGKV